MSAPGSAVAVSSGKVAVISDALELPDDEGKRRFARALVAHAAATGAAVFPITADASLAKRKLLLDIAFIKDVRRSGARTLIYVPYASASSGAIIRAAVLRRLTGIPTVLVALWANPRTRAGDLLVRMLRPDRVLTPSQKLLADLTCLGVRTSLVPMGVDTRRFRPVGIDERRRLREAYKVPTHRPVILHVGHLQRYRNLEWMVQLSNVCNATSIVVGGTASGADPKVVEALCAGKLRVIHEYLPRIEQIYQLADVYCFPVLSERGAIGMPLSVLEAMACNLAVVTTAFGSLPSVLGTTEGLLYAETPAAFIAATQAALRLPKGAVRTRACVRRYSWDNVLETLLAEATAAVH